MATTQVAANRVRSATLSCASPFLPPLRWGSHFNGAKGSYLRDETLSAACELVS